MSKCTSWVAATVIVLSLLLPQIASARQPKKYQVTGTVLEVTKDYIAVDKAGERWEIGRDDAKVSGNVKVGGKVTIEYQMTATSITAK